MGHRTGHAATNSDARHGRLLSVLFLSVQSTLGHWSSSWTPPRWLATQSHRPHPAATATTVPASRREQGLSSDGDLDEYLCETLLEESLAGVVQADSVSEVVHALSRRLAEASISNSSISFEVVPVRGGAVRPPDQCGRSGSGQGRDRVSRYGRVPRADWRQGFAPRT